MAAIDPEYSVRRGLRLTGNRLMVDRLSIPVPRRIRVLAVGKASVPMLMGALKVLRNHVASGILVAPRSERATSSDKILTFRTGHPIPDKEGVDAAMHAIEMINRMHADETLLCLISGGASAMLPAPVHDVPLADKQAVTQSLIRSKASIHEINTVRRHLSELKGGRLAEKCRAGQIVSLIISDVPGNSLPDIGSGLTAPDPTTFRDAIDVLEEFDLWNSAPSSVKNHLRKGLLGHFPDTPKSGDEIFRKVHNVIIADNNVACEAIRSTLNRRRVVTSILTSSVNCEARCLGRILASIARDSAVFERGNALVIGGETTVEVQGTGKGGRNQEVAISAMGEIAGLNGVAIATLGTDGVDGNSPAAGAIVDGRSKIRATQQRLPIKRFIAKNDSYTFFRKLGDNLFTGPTGTNVSDLYLLVRV